MASEPSERRAILVAGAGVFGALLVLVVIAIVASGDAGDPSPLGTTVACAPDDTTCLAAQRFGERPGIIPRPGEGRAPSEPNEPGGREQLALLGLIVVAVAVIAVLITRSARRARAGRSPSGTEADDGTGLHPSP